MSFPASVGWFITTRCKVLINQLIVSVAAYSFSVEIEITQAVLLVGSRDFEVLKGIAVGND